MESLAAGAHASAVLLSRTPVAARRGALCFSALAQAQGNPQLGRVAASFLCPGPWRLLRFHRDSVTFTAASTVVIGGWVLSFGEGMWWARRPQPCCGPAGVGFTRYPSVGYLLGPLPMGAGWGVPGDAPTLLAQPTLCSAHRSPGAQIPLCKTAAHSPWA